MVPEDGELPLGSVTVVSWDEKLFVVVPPGPYVLEEVFVPEVVGLVVVITVSELLGTVELPVDCVLEALPVTYAPSVPKV